MRSNIVFFTLLLCILLANSKLLYRSASDISELHSLKQVGKQQKLVLFATTGFLTSSRGKRTIKSISDYIQSINYNDNLTGVVNIDFSRLFGEDKACSLILKRSLNSLTEIFKIFCKIFVF